MKFDWKYFRTLTLTEQKEKISFWKNWVAGFHKLGDYEQVKIYESYIIEGEKILTTEKIEWDWFQTEPDIDLNWMIPQNKFLSNLITSSQIRFIDYRKQLELVYKEKSLYEDWYKQFLRDMKNIEEGWLKQLQEESRIEKIR